jgi:nitrite reductase/ring-hydroxylating ferredoxin subunit
MAAPTLLWIKIASSIEELPLNRDGLGEIEAGGKQLCLALVPGGAPTEPAAGASPIAVTPRLYACTHKCPHAGGHLSEGYTDALGNIVCPLHRYKFSLANGRNTSGEGYYLRTYPVDVRPDGVYIGFEEKKWGW